MTSPSTPAPERNLHELLTELIGAGRSHLAAAGPETRNALGDWAYQNLPVLFEHVERLQQGARTLGDIVTRQAQMALDATGLHHLIGEDGDGDWAAVWETLMELRLTDQDLTSALVAAWKDGHATAQDASGIEQRRAAAVRGQITRLRHRPLTFTITSSNGTDERQ